MFFRMKLKNTGIGSPVTNNADNGCSHSDLCYLPGSPLGQLDEEVMLTAGHELFAVHKCYGSATNGDVNDVPLKDVNLGYQVSLYTPVQPDTNKATLVRSNSGIPEITEYNSFFSAIDVKGFATHIFRQAIGWLGKHQGFFLHVYDLGLVLMHLKLCHLVFHVQQFCIIGNRNFLVIIKQGKTLTHLVFQVLDNYQSILALSASYYFVKILMH